MASTQDNNGKDEGKKNSKRKIIRVTYIWTKRRKRVNITNTHRQTYRKINFISYA